jgi:hypothetical protein
MSKEKDNKAVVGRWFTEFWGKTVNLGVIDEIAAPDMLLKYSLHEPRRGRAVNREFHLQNCEITSREILHAWYQNDVRTAHISGSGQPSAARTYAAWRPFAVRVPSSSASISASLISAISASVILTSGGRTTARGSLPSSTSASFMRLCISMNGSA